MCEGKEAGVTRWAVDRLEGEIAVLVSDAEAVMEVEIALLPEGCGEGAVLCLEDGLWTRDMAAEADRRARMADRLARLLGRSSVEE